MSKEGCFKIKKLNNGFELRGLKMKNKLNIRQALFTGFFVATILTVANSIFTWENRIYAGFFAFFVSLAISFVSQKLIRG